jgi:hypothetical protein
MPNHVHVIVEPHDGHEITTIAGAWKSFTANEANKKLNRTGQFWMHDSYDHIIRTEKEYDFQCRYVWENPEKAGLQNMPRWRLENPVAEAEIPKEKENREQDARGTIGTTWIPAAGTFDGWPKTAREIRFLDPCMGSGHFIVFALPILARLRMEEENLSAAEAVYATLQDNIFGLEIDERCTQIAAFNVALTAWKIGGYQKLPQLHLACSGIAPQAKLQDWVKLAGNDLRAQKGMERLYKLFEQAPILGSLIDPTAIHETKDNTQQQDLLTAGFEELKPLLEKALKDEKADENRHEMAVAAQGIEKAAEILSQKFTLVGTNVPYLARGKQLRELAEFCEKIYSEAKNDLATVFLKRCLEFCTQEASTCVVLPQNWLFMTTYKKFRELLLKRDRWHTIVRLGPGAFDTISGEVVKAILITISHGMSDKLSHFIYGIDVSNVGSAGAKATALELQKITITSQKSQLDNPDQRIGLMIPTNQSLLGGVVELGKGSVTGDGPHYLRNLWELGLVDNNWRPWLDTPKEGHSFSGRENFVFWKNDGEQVKQEIGAWLRGQNVFRKAGILINKTNLNWAFYTGEMFCDNTGALIPFDKSNTDAVLSFVADETFANAVKEVDQALKVTIGSFGKVPFDLPHWQRIAAERFPHGLPQPFSDDPTQWIFHGHPCGSVIWDEETKKLAHGKLRIDNTVLQVAVARLFGYQWPAELDEKMELAKEQREWVKKTQSLLSHADDDGIICLSALNREQPLAARLRMLLADAYNGRFDELALIKATDSDKTSLEEWLRDDFFAQHCALFHHRPFIWHIWDGRKDGFHVLVNYHKLDHANLQKLTYRYLGDWIRRQDDEVKADIPGAAERLGAAKALQTELANILKGEPPYDIFVRWKPLAQQTIGWHPDINDGVRLNIRPFMQANDVGRAGAGILRSKPNIKWEKDRGKEPRRDKKEYPWFWYEEEPPQDPAGGKEFFGNRWNDVHLTGEFKKKAQEK